MKGLIFDFNGTLYRDSEKHEKAWQLFASKHLSRPISATEFQEYVHGRTNQEAIEFIFKKKFSVSEANEVAAEKEQIYRQLCLDDQEGLHLIEGATELLDNASRQQRSMTIATAAGKENLDFYFSLFNLAKWFDYEKIIYDNGQIKSKPSPDYYLQASRILEKNPQDCIVFEDSLSGILAARNAGIGSVVAIATNHNNAALAHEGVDLVVDDYLDANLRAYLALF